jgi:hypothetical protein
VEQVNAAAKACSADEEDSLASHTAATGRHKLFLAAKALVASLEDPEEEAWRFIMHNNADACLGAAGQCGILKPWAKELMSSKELASMTNADQKLIGK